MLDDCATELAGQAIASLAARARRYDAAEPGRRAPADPFRPAFILFTTGSTASSKAVVLSHFNVLVNSGALAAHHGLVPGRRFLGVLPISYANGLGLLSEPASEERTLDRVPG